MEYRDPRDPEVQAELRRERRLKSSEFRMEVLEHRLYVIEEYLQKQARWDVFRPGQEGDLL